MNENYEKNLNDVVNNEDSQIYKLKQKEKKQNKGNFLKKAGLYVAGGLAVLASAFSTGCKSAGPIQTEPPFIDPTLTYVDKEKGTETTSKTIFDNCFLDSEDLGAEGKSGADLKLYSDILIALEESKYFTMKGKAGVIIANKGKLYVLGNSDLGNYTKRKELGAGFAYLSLEDAVDFGLEIKIADHKLSRADSQLLADVYLRLKTALDEKIVGSAKVSVGGTYDKEAGKDKTSKGIAMRSSVEFHGELKVDDKKDSKNYDVLFLNIKGTVEPEFNKVLASVIQELYTAELKVGGTSCWGKNVNDKTKKETDNGNNRVTGSLGVRVEHMEKEPADLNDDADSETLAKFIADLRYEHRGLGIGVGVNVEYDGQYWKVGPYIGFKFGGPSRRADAKAELDAWGRKLQGLSGDEGPGGIIEEKKK